MAGDCGRRSDVHEKMLHNLEWRKQKLGAGQKHADALFFISAKPDRRKAPLPSLVPPGAIIRAVFLAF